MPQDTGKRASARAFELSDCLVLDDSVRFMPPDPMVCWEWTLPQKRFAISGFASMVVAESCAGESPYASRLAETVTWTDGA